MVDLGTHPFDISVNNTPTVQVFQSDCCTHKLNPNSEAGVSGVLALLTR